MKTLVNRLIIFNFIFLISIASVAEARLGSGRSSMGSRGLRSFGTRSYSTSPNRGFQQPSYASPQQPMAPRPAFNPGSTLGSGGFMRGLMGGIAGGFLGSMLFRSLGHAGMGMPGGSGIGLLEILLFAAIGFFIYRVFASRRSQPVGAYQNMSHHERLQSVEPGPYATSHSAQSNSSEAPTEEMGIETLRRYDTSFDLTRFKDERMDEFLKLESAWNFRDLSSVAQLIEPDLRKQLDSDIQNLRTQQRINRIENIAVRGTELIEAWQEYGKEYATLRFRANLLDYTIDEKSGNLIDGSQSQPVKFEEDWTFVRRVGEPSTANPWKLSAIEA